ncbi:MAG: RNA methyltransferase [Bacteroidales bacterium]|nr:RNA methyltransferase [Bacteroidales bacterium]MDD3989254.1 RNA methyltransferase [Bacteroidales bacterium]
MKKTVFRKLSMNELNRLSVKLFSELPKTPVTIVLDNIRSGHNIGSAFRTADAFALEKIVLCGISSVPPTAEIHKSALGAEESVVWSYSGDSAAAVRRLKEDGYYIISVEQTGNSTKLQSISPPPERKFVLVFGNEVRGVDQQILDISDEVFEIPQFGTKHSLNVSVSIGIVVWEMIRALGKL